MAEVTGARFVVRGRVQGVGFRFFVLRQARLLGLAGSVRNLPDGGVEAQAWGSTPSLAAFRESLREGPGQAHVEAVAEEILAAPAPSTEFRIVNGR